MVIAAMNLKDVYSLEGKWFTRPAIFWLSLQKIVEATLWAQMGLRKRA